QEISELLGIDGSDRSIVTRGNLSSSQIVFCGANGAGSSSDAIVTSIVSESFASSKNKCVPQQAVKERIRFACATLRGLPFGRIRPSPAIDAMTQIEYRFPLVEVRYLVATDHPYHVCFLFATGLRLNASNSPRFNEGSADCGEKSSCGRVVTVQLRENLWLGRNDHAGPQNVSLVDAKPFAQKRKLTFSRVWQGTRVSPNGWGTSTTGSVFSSKRIRRPSKACNCGKPTVKNRIVTK